MPCNVVCKRIIVITREMLIASSDLKDSFEVLPSTALLPRDLIDELPSPSTCKDGVMQNTRCLVLGERLSSLGYFLILC